MNQFFLQFSCSCKDGFSGLESSLIPHILIPVKLVGLKLWMVSVKYHEDQCFGVFFPPKLSPCRKPNGSFQWKLRYGFVWGHFPLQYWSYWRIVCELYTCLGGYTTLSDVGLAYGTQKHKKKPWVDEDYEIIDSIRILVLVSTSWTNISFGCLWKFRARNFVTLFFWSKATNSRKLIETTEMTVEHFFIFVSSLCTSLPQTTQSWSLW